jgi:hypothetical protein
VPPAAAKDGFAIDCLKARGAWRSAGRADVAQGTAEVGVRKTIKVTFTPPAAAFSGKAGAGIGPGQWAEFTVNVRRPSLTRLAPKG